MLREITALTQDTTAPPQTTSLTAIFDRRAILVTSGVYLSLSWMPVVAALVGGVLGGFQARTIKAALFAALVPGLLNYLVLAVLAPISPNLWAERWLVITGYNALLVIGASGTALLKSRLGR